MRTSPPASVPAAVVLLISLGACGSPPVAEVRPAMEDAVAAVSEAAASEDFPTALLSPHCGPTDEVLDSATLEVSAQLPSAQDRSALLDRATRLLRAQGLEADPDPDGPALLTARPQDGDWTLEIASSSGSTLRARATAEVGDGDVPDDVEIFPCG